MLPTRGQSKNFILFTPESEPQPRPNALLGFCAVNSIRIMSVEQSPGVDALVDSSSSSTIIPLHLHAIDFIIPSDLNILSTTQLILLQFHHVATHHMINQAFKLVSRRIKKIKSPALSVVNGTAEVLDFDLVDGELAGLSSTQLAVIPWHEDATERVEVEAWKLFYKRRGMHLERVVKDYEANEGKGVAVKREHSPVVEPEVNKDQGRELESSVMLEQQQTHPMELDPPSVPGVFPGILPSVPTLGRPTEPTLFQSQSQLMFPSTSTSIPLIHATPATPLRQLDNNVPVASIPGLTPATTSGPLSVIASTSKLPPRPAVAPLPASSPTPMDKQRPTPPTTLLHPIPLRPSTLLNSSLLTTTNATSSSSMDVRRSPSPLSRPVTPSVIPLSRMSDLLPLPLAHSLHLLTLPGLSRQHLPTPKHLADLFGTKSLKPDAIHFVPPLAYEADAVTRTAYVGYFSAEKRIEAHQHIVTVVYQSRWTIAAELTEDSVEVGWKWGDLRSKVREAKWKLEVAAGNIPPVLSAAVVASGVVGGKDGVEENGVGRSVSSWSSSSTSKVMERLKAEKELLRSRVEDIITPSLPVPISTQSTTELPLLPPHLHPSVRSLTFPATRPQLHEPLGPVFTKQIHSIRLHFIQTNRTVPIYDVIRTWKPVVYSNSSSLTIGVNWYLGFASAIVREQALKALKPVFAGVAVVELVSRKNMKYTWIEAKEIWEWKYGFGSSSMAVSGSSEVASASASANGQRERSVSMTTTTVTGRGEGSEKEVGVVSPVAVNALSVAPVASATIPLVVPIPVSSSSTSKSTALNLDSVVASTAPAVSPTSTGIAHAESTPSDAVASELLTQPTEMRWRSTFRPSPSPSPVPVPVPVPLPSLEAVIPTPEGVDGAGANSRSGEGEASPPVVGVDYDETKDEEGNDLTDGWLRVVCSEKNEEGKYPSYYYLTDWSKILWLSPRETAALEEKKKEDLDRRRAEEAEKEGEMRARGLATKAVMKGEPLLRIGESGGQQLDLNLGGVASSVTSGAMTSRSGSFQKPAPTIEARTKLPVEIKGVSTLTSTSTANSQPHTAAHISVGPNHSISHRPAQSTTATQAAVGSTSTNPTRPRDGLQQRLQPASSSATRPMTDRIGSTSSAVGNSATPSTHSLKERIGEGKSTSSSSSSSSASTRFAPSSSYSNQQSSYSHDHSSSRYAPTRDNGSNNKGYYSNNNNHNNAGADANGSKKRSATEAPYGNGGNQSSSKRQYFDDLLGNGNGNAGSSKGRQEPLSKRLG